MNAPTPLMVFRLEGQRYALSLSAVERVVAAVEVTALPGAPEAVLGIINVAGVVVPVFNVRRRFGLPERAVAPLDQFLIARTAQRTVALVVDEALGVMASPAAESVDAGRLVSKSGQIHGVVKLPDGLVLIHDLEKFLSAEETQRLDEALDQEARHAT